MKDFLAGIDVLGWFLVVFDKSGAASSPVEKALAGEDGALAGADEASADEDGALAEADRASGGEVRRHRRHHAA